MIILLAPSRMRQAVHDALNFSCGDDVIIFITLAPTGKHRGQSYYNDIILWLCLLIASLSLSVSLSLSLSLSLSGKPHSSLTVQASYLIIPV